jgi:hypothetical protein
MPAAAAEITCSPAAAIKLTVIVNRQRRQRLLQQLSHTMVRHK